ncbi:MAG TPA: polysaccharide deacetylase family protein [Steroidobacteraceae bacterium]|nr:polysaccharide deacetylase family protein [Steroidobacteraceae bacterium]HVC02626.1 polysaccharide deacetylase family protein [Steroidobacteraceae bacterium]
MAERRTDPAPRRAAPSPLIAASVAGHALAGIAWIVRPRIWPVALAAVVADQLLLVGAGLWPRSSLLGPNWTRLPATPALQGRIAITIDDGPDPRVTPAVLSILDRFGVAATFFCIGERVERHRDLAREIVRRGHAIENHSYRHSHAFSLLGAGAQHADIARAQECIADAAGVAPRFFRAPAGLRNPLLQPVLARLGLQLASWSRRGYDTVTHDPGKVLQRLTRSLRGGEILLLHDGHAARTAAGTAVAVEILPPLLEALRERQLVPITLRSALTAQRCGQVRKPG